MTINPQWEAAFNSWAKPPAKTEQERIENAEQAVHNAIASSVKLKNRNIRVFAQGSYRNNTNVRSDSDVDLGVLCEDTFFHTLPDGYTPEKFSIEPATYTYPEYKSDIKQALISYFGEKSVTSGSRAFDIHGNTYHVDADVAPFFVHRRYNKDGTYLLGVELRSDKGERVINWPEQHYSNGVQKNNDTKKRFKSLVRIMKALSNYMAEKGVDVAKQTPSFLLECLAWNVPNEYFGHDTYTEDLRACLASIFNNTLTDEKCSEWGEVSELKYLFRGAQKWTRQQAHDIISSAWDYVGFE
ncbi:MAG: nucleotidyltransferase [Candidatus Margulisiibacteriota bacterium]